ncbi:MAG: GPR1/FUN34/YaaH family transporter [Marmoricola sp.]
MADLRPAPIPGAHFADPAPLGLGAFALTTCVLSCVNMNWIPASTTGIVLGLALAMGGGAQLLAGMWEFAKGNTFGATAFSSFGAFWISFWWLAEHDLGGLGSDAHKALGWYLVAWGIFTAYMAVAALRVSGAVLTVFVLLTITFFLLAAGDFNTSMNLTKTGGYFGLLTAIAAWYTAFAGVTKSTFGRDVLPTYPLARHLID